MRSIQRKQASWRGPIIFGVVLVTVIVLVCAATYFTFRSSGGYTAVKLQLASEKFPDIQVDKLSPLRVRAVNILRQQYDNPQPGPFYSQGEKQDWCANFVSWVSRQAGAPLTNPHSGGWRIPGVRSLETYYRNAGKFRAANSGYQLQPGDAIMYDNASRHGEHVNFVLKYDNGKVTTIGGNEGGVINIQQSDLDRDGPIRGFGLLE